MKMTSTCKKYHNEIPDLDLSGEVRVELWALIHQDLKLFAIKKLMDEQTTTHREAKIIVGHLNRKYGERGTCAYDGCSFARQFN